MSLHEEQPLDLSIIASTPIQYRISPQVVAQALSQPPFLPIPGALNIRDIAISPYVRKGFIYRSGALGHLSQSGKASLSERYGIETIFDLRTRAERDRGPSPAIEGVATVWTTNSADTGDGVRVLHKINPKDFVEEDGKIGYLKMYTNILDSHKDAFKTVLLHLRDQSQGGILFHCTAGRDRTGVLAALILGIAGAPPDAIAIDYSLTRIGIEPAHEQLLAIFQAQSGFAIDEPGFMEMCSTQAKTMLSFLKMLEEKWGGVEGYLKEELDIGDSDLERIRKILREK